MPIPAMRPVLGGGNQVSLTLPLATFLCAVALGRNSCFQSSHYLDFTIVPRIVREDTRKFNQMYMYGIAYILTAN